MAFLDPLLNPVLQPLLNSSPFLGIVIISLFISVIITLAYKFLTNQREMKLLREEQKGLQSKMKELRSNPEEMMRVQKEAMKKNMEYMKHSLKASLITMLPVILIFTWMSSNLMYEPIFPQERYSITALFEENITGNVELIADEGTEILNEGVQPTAGEITWNLKSSEGEHFLTIKTDRDQQTKKVLITTKFKYEPAVSTYSLSEIKQIKINYNELKPLGPDISLLGWHPGWLGLYFIFSIIFSISLRKVFKIY